MMLNAMLVSGRDVGKLREIRRLPPDQKRAVLLGQSPQRQQKVREPC